MNFLECTDHPERHVSIKNEKGPIYNTVAENLMV